MSAVSGKDGDADDTSTVIRRRLPLDSSIRASSRSKLDIRRSARPAAAAVAVLPGLRTVEPSLEPSCAMGDDAADARNAAMARSLDIPMTVRGYG